ncbi:hypothetical protein IW140_005727 [Coemansia sp. RSA 1813]|nr:hypothetical protein EV178_005723 [Coemansia sp. RSA 1646]KAJ1768183.1 hypothetical protein LPJ74_004960 [Coemansia sp. RSA 1843]KAJ2086433.1 hypothetical protein IW138_005678 [Coemansia sp. RSA 986]KAJ2211116.1 hypothetical protein EV179_005763 [Coemansia sp. RSA 487]KAJ2564545.1 hypothetical protein IW140_005727 [Coemansia sp. RSA 1813]
MLTAPSSQPGTPPTAAEFQTHIIRKHHPSHNHHAAATQDTPPTATYNGFHVNANKKAKHVSADSTVQNLHNMNIARTSKTFHVVIIGGSFAGIRAAQDLESLLLPHIATITVIERRDQYFYNLGALRAMVKPELIDLMWLPYDNIFHYPHNRVIKGEVSSVYPNSVILSDGHKVDFDSLLVASGSVYPPPCKVETTSSVRGIAELRMFSEMVHESDSILIIGGGPTGVGLAAEIATEYPSKVVIIIHSGPRLMSTETNSKAMSRKAHRKLKSMGVRVLLNERVIIPENDPLKHRVEGRWLKTSKGRMIFSHFQFLCNGITFKTSFMDTLDPIFKHKIIDDKSQQIRVLPTLQVNHPELPWIFAAGDVCNTGGEKQAYRADSQGSHVARCMARMADLWYRGESRWFDVQLKQWHDPAQFMAVAMGPNSGVTETPWIVLGDIPTRIMKSKELFLARRYKEFNLEFPGMPKYVSGGDRDMSLVSKSPSFINAPDSYISSTSEFTHSRVDKRQKQKQQQKQQRIRKHGGVATDLTHEVYNMTHAMANVALSAADNLDNYVHGERITLGQSAVQKKQANRNAVVAFPYAELYYSRQKHQQISPTNSDASDNDDYASSEENDLHNINSPPGMEPSPTTPHLRYTNSNLSPTSKRSTGSSDAHYSTTDTRDAIFRSSVSLNTTNTERSAISSNSSRASHTQTLMHGPVLPRHEKKRSLFSSRSFIKSQDEIREGNRDKVTKSNSHAATPPPQMLQRSSDPLYHSLMDSACTSSTATIHLEQYN